MRYADFIYITSYLPVGIASPIEQCLYFINNNIMLGASDIAVT